MQACDPNVSLAYYYYINVSYINRKKYAKAMIVLCTNFRHKINEIGTNKQQLGLIIIFNPLVVTSCLCSSKARLTDRTASLSSSVV